MGISGGRGGSKPSGLPKGVFANGRGFRHRGVRSASQFRWSRNFATPAEAYADLRASQADRAVGRGAGDGRAVLAAGAGGKGAASASASASAIVVAAAGHGAAGQVTLAGWLTGRWFDHYCRRGHQYATLVTVRQQVDDHLMPLAWFQLPLTAVRHQHIQEWADEVLREWDRSGGDRGLSRSTVSHLLVYLRQAYRLALADGAANGVLASPVSEVRLAVAPVKNRFARGTARAVGVGDVAALARLLLAQDLATLWLMFLCGLRIGEAMGLPLRNLDLRKGRLLVTQQYGHWFDVGPETPVGWEANAREAVPRTTRYVKPWPKSEAAYRYLYLGPWLTAFLDEYIRRYHGPSPDKDALLCQVNGVGPSAMDQGFRRRLTKACAVLDLAVDLDADDPADVDGDDDRPWAPDGPDPLTDGGLRLRPHDLRRSVGGLLHHHAVSESIEARARSAYLGHQHPGVWDESLTTGVSYTPVVEESMHRIAALVDRLAAEHIGPDPWVGAVPAGDALLSTDEAAAYVGAALGRCYTRVRLLRLHADGLLPRAHNPDVAPRSSQAFWFLRSHLDTLVPLLRDDPPPGTVRRATAASLLGVSLRRLDGMVAQGELDPAVPDGPGQHVLVTETSLGTLFAVERRLRAGALLTVPDAARVLGCDQSLVAQRAKAGHLPSVRSGRRFLVDAAAVRVLAGRLDGPDPLLTVPEAARIAGVTRVSMTRWVQRRTTDRVGGRIGVRTSLLTRVMREKGLVA